MKKNSKSTRRRERTQRHLHETVALPVCLVESFCHSSGDVASMDQVRERAPRNALSLVVGCCQRTRIGNIG